MSISSDPSVSARDFLAFAAAALDVPGSELSLETRRGDVSAWDSVGHLKLAMELEARWGVRIPLGRVPELERLADFYAFVPNRPAKVFAVDADNTLWRGVSGEDGPDAVSPFAAFQRGLLDLRRRGVPLVLLSRNDPPPEGAIARVFARADNPLKLEDFAFAGVNWEPKSGNLLAAARALGLPPSCFVFLDDNPRERAAMRAQLPEVMTAEFPSGADPAELLPELERAHFAAAGRTAEDLLRADWRPLVSTSPEYLATLGQRAHLARATAADVPRLAQMSERTNRFNATAIRRTEDDFRRLLADPAWETFVCRARDRFGDMGTVCYVVRERATGRVTDFVVSCRALGRTLERLVARRLGIRAFDYRPTGRNAEAKAFLDELAAGGETPVFFEEE